MRIQDALLAGFQNYSIEWTSRPRASQHRQKQARCGLVGRSLDAHLSALQKLKQSHASSTMCRDSLSKCGTWFEPFACLAAGASACTLCGVGTYSVNHPSFTISGATCKPQVNQDYFDRNTLVNGYPSYHSADNNVFVWSYEASNWLVGALSSVGNSSFWAYASCRTSGCPISSAVSWAEYCAASNQETADLSFLPGPSAGHPSPGL